VTPDELPLATLDLHRAALALAAPCHCGRTNCNLATHLWHATKDMTPGIRAQAYEPRTITPGGPPTDHEPRPDPTITAHTDYTRDVQAAARAARTLLARIESHRPDRWIPPVDTTISDSEFCTNHLENFGSCELRHRGDLCRFCDDIRRLHGFTPDRPLMRAKHEGRRITDRDIADARKRVGRNHQKRRKTA
jgi:hypothetical protein